MKDSYKKTPFTLACLFGMRCKIQFDIWASCLIVFPCYIYAAIFPHYSFHVFLLFSLLCVPFKDDLTFLTLMRRAALCISIVEALCSFAFKLHTINLKWNCISNIVIIFLWWTGMEIALWNILFSALCSFALKLHTINWNGN